jgi:hypothetical protein
LGLVPLVTVSVGDGPAVLRLTDADAAEPLTADQWSRAQAVVERVAAPIGDGDERPLVFVHRTLVVEVPSLALAEHLARFFLPLELPTGLLPRARRSTSARVAWRMRFLAVTHAESDGHPK